jgi:hypothetical protein
MISELSQGQPKQFSANISPSSETMTYLQFQYFSGRMKNCLVRYIFHYIFYSREVILDISFLEYP